MNPRTFYDTAYHFADDDQFPDFRRLERSLAPLLPLDDLSLLDLGCGAGWAGQCAMRAGARRVIGVDFSMTALAAARRREARIAWVLGDGERLPLPEACVDRVYCNGAIEHFADVPRGLREFRRVLRAGGRGVLVVPNFYVRTEQPREFRATDRRWRRMLADAGLTVLSRGVDYGPPIRGAATTRRKILRAAGKIVSHIPALAYQFIFCLTPTPGTV